MEEFVRELAVETLDQTWCCATLGHFESSDSANSLLYCSAWPPQTQVALEMNRLQRQMTSRATVCFRDPLERYERYRRRIGRDCSEAINGSWWSKHWFDTACAFRDHLDRDWERQRLHYSAGVSPSLLSTCISWSLVIVNTWCSEWLSQQRHFSENDGRMESRLHRRTFSDYVAQRWADGVD